MGFAFRAMIFVIAFNLATGIIIYAFGAGPWLNSLPADAGTNQIIALNNTMSTAGSVPVEESSFWYRFLDVISLGFYQKIKLFLNTTIFSIPTLFTRLGLLPDGLVPYLQGGIMLVFILGMFELFTGKDLTIR